MTQIDWANAPEGYDFHIDWIYDRAYFYRDGGDRYIREGGYFAKKADIGRDVIITNRPVIAAWTGEGLPPVGTVCIITPHNTIWGFSSVADYQCKVIAYHDDYVWVDLVDVLGVPVATRTDKVGFTQIRTPEQIAAEEIQAIRDKIGYQRPQLGICPVEAMYNLGYRKMMAGAEEVKA